MAHQNFRFWRKHVTGHIKMDDVQTPPDMSFTSSPRIVPSMLGDWTGKKVRLMGIVSGSIFLAYFACHPFRVLPAVLNGPVHRSAT